MAGAARVRGQAGADPVAKGARAQSPRAETMTHAPWGYSKDKGPDRWREAYPFAAGSNQSPVAILTKNVHSDPILLPWFTGYDPGASKTIKNTGKSCRIAFDDTFDRSVLRGGPLPKIYRLRQLLIHWGSTDDKGSEHVVDLQRHAGEIQLVHWCSKSSNYLDACRKNDGVAILAMFLKVGKNPKPEMKRIIEELDAIKTKMAKFRTLSCNAANEPFSPLEDNWRPLQPLNHRMIRTTCQ